DKVNVQALTQGCRKLVANDDISRRAGITNHFHGCYCDVGNLQRLKRGAAEVKLRQRLGLTLTNPVAVTPRSLPNKRHTERHTTQARDVALTKSTKDGLRTKVIHKVRKHAT